MCLALPCPLAVPPRVAGVRNHPVAVCLGHEDLDFASRLKLGRSDDYGFFCSHFNNRERKAQSLQKTHGYTLLQTFSQMVTCLPMLLNRGMTAWCRGEIKEFS